MIFRERNIIYMLIASFLSGFSITASADEFSPLTIDDQVKRLKREMVELGRDVTVLEDILLYPADSRVSVYLAADSGNYFSIESVKLLLNGEVVMTYQYTEREQKGFVKGAAQKLYIGNVKKGKHKIVAFVQGVGPRGRKYKRGASLIFNKKDEAQSFKLLIEDNPRRQKPNFVIKEYS